MLRIKQNHAVTCYESLPAPPALAPIGFHFADIPMEVSAKERSVCESKLVNEQ